MLYILNHISQNLSRNAICFAKVDIQDVTSFVLFFLSFSLLSPMPGAYAIQLEIQLHDSRC